MWFDGLRLRDSQALLAQRGCAVSVKTVSRPAAALRLKRESGQNDRLQAALHSPCPASNK